MVVVIDVELLEFAMHDEWLMCKEQLSIQELHVSHRHMYWRSIITSDCPVSMSSKPACLYLALFVPICLSVSACLCLSVRLPVCLIICLSVCHFVYHSRTYSCPSGHWYLS